MISWSPNGNQLVFYLPVYQKNAVNHFFIDYDINLLDINSGSVRKITQKPEEYGSLIWSPDGKQIAFTNGDFSQSNLYVMYINNLKSIQIAPTLPASFIEGVSWSGDSQKLAFSTRNKTKGTIFASNLYVVNRDGSKLMKLSETNDSSITNLTWKP